MDSIPQENVDSKTEFRKPLNDAGNRKYRRRSPLGRSSSSYDDSPEHQCISSPINSRKDIEKVDDGKRRNDESRDLDRDFTRSQYSRSGESYKHSDRHSSRNCHSYLTHDDYSMQNKHVDEYDYPKSSSRSGRDSRDYYNLDYHHRSREHPHDVDKYSSDRYEISGHRSRDKDKNSSSDRAGSGMRYTNIEDAKWDRNRHRQDRGARDGKTDHRSSGDYRSDRSPAYEEFRGQSRRDSSGHRLKEASWRETKELDGEKYPKEEKKRFDDRDKYKERHYEEPEEHSEDKKALSSKDHESFAKKPKLFSSDSTSSAIYATLADGNQSSSSKQVPEASAKAASEQDYVKDSDIDAAKIAAMKAAELVNRNLIGTGYMSTDQKKKLLWGNKKSTTTEEPAHHWDSSIFGDRERQEKFNKLMSLRLPWYRYPIVGRERRRESGAEARRPGSGEAEGATPAGFGEAIHCWIAPEGWSDGWFGSLGIYVWYLGTCSSEFYAFVLFYASRTFISTL